MRGQLRWGLVLSTVCVSLYAVGCGDEESSGGSAGAAGTGGAAGKGGSAGSSSKGGSAGSSSP
jgi:hypothetical protein